LGNTNVKESLYQRTVQLACPKLVLHHFYQVNEHLDYQLSVKTPLYVFKVETFPPRCNMK